MRLVIVGNSGSGKTSLARVLAQRFNLLRLELDEIFWVPGTAEAREPEVVEAELAAFLERHSGWIVEGVYAGLARQAAQHADALVWLEPGLEACLANTEARAFEPEKFADPQDQADNLPALRDWVRAYYTRTDECSLAAHHALFDDFSGAKLRVDSLDALADQLSAWLARSQAA